MNDSKPKELVFLPRELCSGMDGGPSSRLVDFIVFSLLKLLTFPNPFTIYKKVVPDIKTHIQQWFLS